MNSANISELRDRLSDYLRRVRRGETIIVLDRDTPVARLEPVGRSHEDLPACYQQALKDGLVRPPRKRDDFLRGLAAPPKPKKHAGLVEALVEERRTSR
jgi:prevent-host-death family protein